MVHPRNAPSTGETDREMALAGSRFETYVRAAMKEADDMSLAELARASGVKETNWHGWFRGEHKPRRNTMTLAGRVLRRTPDQLLAVWDGDRPQKPRGATETTDALVMALRGTRQRRSALLWRNWTSSSIPVVARTRRSQHSSSYKDP